MHVDTDCNIKLRQLFSFWDCLCQGHCRHAGLHDNWGQAKQHARSALACRQVQHGLLTGTRERANFYMRIDFFLAWPNKQAGIAFASVGLKHMAAAQQQDSI